MAARGKLIAKLLRDVAAEVEKMSDDQVAMVDDGILVVKFTFEAKLNQRGKSERKPELTTYDDKHPTEEGTIRPITPEQIVAKINNSTDRDSASSVINSMNITKKHLEEVCRHLSISTSGSESRASMVEKIINSTIGARLRSAAIQSLGGDS